MKKIKSISPLDTYIRIILLSIILFWSFKIIEPFILISVWSIIISVSIYPSYKWFVDLAPEKFKKVMTGAFILVLLSIIILPTINFTDSAIEYSQSIIKKFETKEYEISKIDAIVKDWPVVGEQTHEILTSNSNDIELYIKTHSEKIKEGVKWFLGLFKDLITTIVLSLGAIVISGILLMNSNKSYKFSSELSNKIIPKKGDDFIDMCVSTIRNVVKGILLVGVIQALLAYAGFIAIGLPKMAGILGLLVLIIAIIQLPIPIVTLPVIIYVFYTKDVVPAIIFTVYITFVSVVDNIIKPIMFSKGLETPMLIIFIGSLGGMIFQGLMGLFIGPVVLAIVYKLYIHWVSSPEIIEENALEE